MFSVSSFCIKYTTEKGWIAFYIYNNHYRLLLLKKEEIRKE